MNIEKIEINGHYVWVDKNAEIKEGDWVISSTFTIVQSFYPENVHHRDIKKIIAASPELNLEGVPTYVEWLAEQNGCYDSTEQNKGFPTIKAFVKGYQTAEKELPTWDDVRKAIEMARKELKVPYEVREGHTIIDYCHYSEKEIIEQLKNQKS